MSGTGPVWDGTGVPPMGKTKGAAVSRRQTAENDVTVTVGEPGTVHGVDTDTATLIGDLNDAADWGALLGEEAWPEGTWIEYGPEGKAAHWAGTRWKTGKAPA